MFELLINLMLTGLFLQSQSDQQVTINNLAGQEDRLPLAELKKLPQKDNNSDSLGVVVTAQSVLVADADTGKILYSKNPQEVRPIASITKLMTALVFVDNNPSWDKEVEISSSDYRAGAVTYLIAGEKVSARDVFYTMMVASANEAAVALARSTGLSTEEFVVKMNSKAKELGMTGTTFTDMTGLENSNKSTATDIIILLNHALKNNDIASASGSREKQISIINKGITRKIKSTDQILQQEFGLGADSYKVVAGKTGYLELAGYCFASKVSDQAGRNIFAVVLGSDTVFSRFTDTKSLAYWVFNNYKWQ